MRFVDRITGLGESIVSTFLYGLKTYLPQVTEKKIISFYFLFLRRIAFHKGLIVKVRW